MRSLAGSGKPPRLLLFWGSSAVTAAAGLSPAPRLIPPVEDVRINKKHILKPRWVPSPCLTVALPKCIFHMLIFCVVKETVPHQLQVPASLQGAPWWPPVPFLPILVPPPPSTGAVGAGCGDRRGRSERSRKQLLFSGRRGLSATRLLRKGERREVRFPPVWSCVLVVAGCREHSHS